MKSEKQIRKQLKIAKISRKEYIEIKLMIALFIALIPFIYLYKKYDDFWNKKCIKYEEF